MKFFHLTFFIIFLFVYAISCKSGNFTPDFEMAGGYVIGKERCNADTLQDYYIIDLSIFPLPNLYGDSLLINGFTYKHVVKTTGLAPQFKYFGARVGFDFHLSSTAVQTKSCIVTMPDTYLLKEMKILSQAEIR
jgi:hypothetical protein